jgi:hypothetical protein
MEETLMVDPWVRNPQAALVPGPFREGDHVSFLFVSDRVEGVITEDRGNLGVGGRRLYRVKALGDQVSEDWEIEVPAEALQLVAKAKTR